MRCCPNREQHSPPSPAPPQSALKEGAKSLDFMGRAIAVDANAGIFVTLNPAGKGYGGRSRLPDNLKQLFRWDARLWIRWYLFMGL